MKKIIAFSGSNSSKSINQQLVTIAVQYASTAEVEVISLRDYPAVMYGIDEETENGFPESMKALHAKLEEADGFILSTPEHNGSMPAVLKNTIDWQSRMGRKVFNQKPLVLLAASPGGRGGASVLAHLGGLLPRQGATLVGTHGVGAYYDKVQNGALVEGEDAEAIKKLVAELEQQL